jgi:hypothetical protein
MIPKPPLSHRILASDLAMVLYRLIGRPPITYRYRGVVTEMSAGPGDSTCVKTTKTLRAKDF